MIVDTPRVDEHTRTLRAENDALSKALAAHREFLVELARVLDSDGLPSLACMIDQFLTQEECW